jgi:hypothetical protein
MFHPIGSQPPQVYWRRRLMFAASLILFVLLLALTVNAVTSSGDRAVSAAGDTSPGHTAAAAAPASVPRTTAAATTTKPASSVRPSSSSSSPAHSPSPTPPPTCVAKGLRVAAVPQHTSYAIGDRPVLQLRVTNTGSKPCVQDLGDTQVELKVYNGESRVWGSHDCKVEPGTTPRTLAPGVPVLVALTWSGLTSQSPCTGTRQRVGAGTYTLYGSLAGRTGTAGRFTIS